MSTFFLEVLGIILLNNLWEFQLIQKTTETVSLKGIIQNINKMFLLIDRCLFSIKRSEMKWYLGASTHPS